MNPDQDPLWYDREEADEPMGGGSLLISLIVIALERIIFLPGEFWLNVKLGTIATFKDVKDIQQ